MIEMKNILEKNFTCTILTKWFLFLCMLYNYLHRFVSIWSYKQSRDYLKFTAGYVLVIWIYYTLYARNLSSQDLSISRGPGFKSP